MKTIIVKSIALVLILAFGLILLPQQAEAGVACWLARAACAAAAAGAVATCATFGPSPACAAAVVAAGYVCAQINNHCD